MVLDSINIYSGKAKFEFVLVLSHSSSFCLCFPSAFERCSPIMSVKPTRVCITGAAGQIGYNLVFAVARGDMLGPKQPVILHLLDIPPMMDVLNGTVMELHDCAFPMLAGKSVPRSFAVTGTDVRVRRCRY